MPHLMFSVLVAMLLASAIALLGDRSLRERVYAAAYLVLCCAAATLVGGWVMHVIHG